MSDETLESPTFQVDHRCQEGKITPRRKKGKKRGHTIPPSGFEVQIPQVRKNIENPRIGP